MIGFTTEPAGLPLVPSEAVFSSVINMVAELYWDDIATSMRWEKQSVGLGFGQTDIVLLSFNKHKGTQAFRQESEAHVFADAFNANMARVRGNLPDLQPSFNQPVASVTRTGEVAINLELLRDFLNKNPQSLNILNEMAANYVKGRRTAYSEGRFFANDAEFAEAPELEQSAIKPFLNEMADHLNWNGVGATINYETVPALGFGEREVAQLSFIRADGTALAEGADKQEAVKFHSALLQFIDKRAFNVGVPLKNSTMQVTDDGKVNIDLEMLHSIARKDPAFLFDTLHECRLYADNQHPVFQEAVDLGGDSRQTRAHMSPHEMQVWHRDMAQVFRTGNLETLFVNAQAEEKTKLIQFCTKLSSYVFMMNIEPEKFEGLKEKDPAFAEAVEAYADYIMHKQMARSGVAKGGGTEFSEPQKEANRTFAGRESNRNSPDNRFPQRS